MELDARSQELWLPCYILIVWPWVRPSKSVVDCNDSHGVINVCVHTVLSYLTPLGLTDHVIFFELVDIN